MDFTRKELIEDIQAKLDSNEPFEVSIEDFLEFMKDSAFVKRETIESVIWQTEAEEKHRQLALGMLDSIPDSEPGLICSYDLGLTLSQFLGEFEKVPPGLMRIRYRITNTERVPIVKTREGFKFHPSQMQNIQFTGGPDGTYT